MVCVDNRFHVIDVDAKNPDISKHDKLGSLEVTLAQIGRHLIISTAQHQTPNPILDRLPLPSCSQFTRKHSPQTAGTRREAGAQGRDQNCRRRSSESEADCKVRFARCEIVDNRKLIHVYIGFASRPRILTRRICLENQIHISRYTEY